MLEPEWESLRETEQARLTMATYVSDIPLGQHNDTFRYIYVAALKGRTGHIDFSISDHATHRGRSHCYIEDDACDSHGNKHASGKGGHRMMSRESRASSFHRFKEGPRMQGEITKGGIYSLVFMHSSLGGKGKQGVFGNRRAWGLISAREEVILQQVSKGRELDAVHTNACLVLGLGSGVRCFGEDVVARGNMFTVMWNRLGTHEGWGGGRLDITARYTLAGADPRGAAVVSRSMTAQFPLTLMSPREDARSMSPNRNAARRHCSGIPLRRPIGSARGPWPSRSQPTHS